MESDKEESGVEVDYIFEYVSVERGMQLLETLDREGLQRCPVKNYLGTLREAIRKGFPPAVVDIQCVDFLNHEGVHRAPYPYPDKLSAEEVQELEKGYEQSQRGEMDPNALMFTPSSDADMLLLAQKYDAMRKRLVRNLKFKARKDKLHDCLNCFADDLLSDNQSVRHLAIDVVYDVLVK